MSTIPQYVCAVIPPHMSKRVAGQTTDEASGRARATLAQMREVATGRAAASLREVAAEPAVARRRRQNRHVYNAQHRFELPGDLSMCEGMPPSKDIEVREAFDGCGATSDFYSRVFGRDSIDGKGMRLDSTVHYGAHFENAFWNGHQIVYGDGDGRLFNRFTASLEVTAHELTHGVLQYAAALGYHGQTGALNEHLADAFGIMVRQYTLNQSASESGWLIGDGILGPEVQGYALRSFAFPGTAYDDPILGRDPQPSHMDDYVFTTEDYGGVHINSGILNHAFYLAAMEIGGKPWETLGPIWYLTVIERLRPDANFADFARAAVDIAGELFGIRSRIQRIVADALADVGLPVPLIVPGAGCAGSHERPRARHTHAYNRNRNHNESKERKNHS